MAPRRAKCRPEQRSNTGRQCPPIQPTSQSFDPSTNFDGPRRIGGKDVVWNIGSTFYPVPRRAAIPQHILVLAGMWYLCYWLYRHKIFLKI